MNVSIITVNYKVKDKIIKCIASIEQNTKALDYEVIVVDNEGDNDLKAKFKDYKNVKYIRSPKNLGFGGGNNLGARHANGKYLFFLNPDTLVTENAIKVLYEFLDKNKTSGIVSPLILGNDKTPLDRQGYKELNLINGIFTFSFLRKKFPQYAVSSYYSLEDWEKVPIRKVDTVYGAAMMISAETFNRVNGFDEDYFLYFEENDLSRRVRKLNFNLYINSNARIIHEIGQSTKQLEDRDKYFARSRFRYFRKHCGIIQAILLEAILKINKLNTILFIGILFGLFLRLFNLENNMSFIGDQGWFYLSARDMLIYGKIPLVGITSSHLWLHQGPLWTYMLALVLPIFSFSPVSGAFLTIFTGLLSIVLIYKLGKEMFSPKAGAIASLLYAVSPAIIAWDRTPFDPSPIPLFSLLYFYSIYKWIKGDKKYFPLILFFIAVLYNLELATFSLFFPLILIFLYGYINKKSWLTNIISRKTFLYSIIAFTTPMLPVLIYDLANGFKQTVVFSAWVIYKPLSIFFLRSGGRSFFDFSTIFNFLLESISRLLFSYCLVVATLIFGFGLIYLLIKIFRKPKLPFNLLLIFILFGLGGVLINQTPSNAYLPIIFPFVILLAAIFMEYLSTKSRIVYLVLIVILVFNVYSSYLEDLGTNLADRIKAVDRIIALTGRQDYNLLGKGNASQFESFTMNYEYLLWWKGHPVSNTPKTLKIIIEEHNGKIFISKIK